MTSSVSRKDIEGTRHTILDLASIGTSMAALGISRLGFNVIGSKALGLSLVGSANLCLSMALLIGLPTSAGLAAAISRFVPLLGNRDEIRHALSITLRLTIAIVTLGVLLSVMASRFAPSLQIDGPQLAVIALWAILYGAYAIGRAHLYAERRVRLALGLELTGLIAFGAALLVATARPSLWWIPFAVYPLPVAARVVLISVRARLRDRPRLRPEFSTYAWFAFLGSASSLGIQYGSTLVVGALGGATQAGVWATMTSLAAPVLLLPRSLSTLYLPRLSKASATSRESFDALSSAHERLATVCALPIVAIAMIAGPFLLPVVLGENARGDAIPTWTLLCLSTYVICRKEPLITAIAALGQAGINASAAFVGAVACGAIWMCAPIVTGHLLAISIGTVVQATISPAVAASLARRRDPSHRLSSTLHLSDGAMLLLTACQLLGPADLRFTIAGSVAVLAVALVESRRARVAYRLRGLS